MTVAFAAGGGDSRSGGDGKPSKKKNYGISLGFPYFAGPRLSIRIGITSLALSTKLASARRRCGAVRRIPGPAQRTLSLPPD